MTKIFITGGISSGKSSFAEDTAISIYKSIAIGGNMRPDMQTNAGASGSDRQAAIRFIRPVGQPEKRLNNHASGQAEHSLHFIATAKFNGEGCRGEDINDGFDEEMAFKIKKHKYKRDPAFAVHENFEDLVTKVKDIYESLEGKDGVILIDSMTLWLSSIFKSIPDYDSALETILKFSKYLAEIKCSVITVVDSLGFNMVPVDAYVRKFIELNGLMEQELSYRSDKSYCVIAGNPVILK